MSPVCLDGEDEEDADDEDDEEEEEDEEEEGDEEGCVAWTPTLAPFPGLAVIAEVKPLPAPGVLV